MLSREEHAVILARILEQPEAANVSEQVTQLAENYAAALAEITLTGEQVEDLKKVNSDLVQQNMKLFLKIGTGEPEKLDELPSDKPLPKFEDLIGENGHIF